MLELGGIKQRPFQITGRRHANTILLIETALYVSNCRALSGHDTQVVKFRPDITTESLSVLELARAHD